jgi:hypothetical protein
MTAFMKVAAKYIKELSALFAGTKDKREANYRSVQLLTDMSGDEKFLTDILEMHLRKKGSLNTLHYPTVGIDIELNEYYGLVANCWIPLPDRSTNISTKAIHHHGDMLLSTATAFGTGYEHWMFETPAVVDAEKEIYDLKLIERAPHPVNHVAFVDAYVAHLPLYPPDLTITFALWSSQYAPTWKDKIKRVPFLQNHSERLREIGRKFGLVNSLDLKVVEYFDFFPDCDGFHGIRERREFPRTNNEDYLASLFYVIQGTGNDALASVVREKLASGERIANRALVEKYAEDLENGVAIQGRVSDAHYGVPTANFTSEAILDALNAQARRSAPAEVAK